MQALIRSVQDLEIDNPGMDTDDKPPSCCQSCCDKMIGRIAAMTGGDEQKTKDGVVFCAMCSAAICCMTCEVLGLKYL